MDCNIISRSLKLHFEDNDFIQESTDKKNRHRNARGTKKLQRLRLKNLAVLHIFPHLPQYTIKEKSTSRFSAATSFARLTKQSAVIDELVAKLSQLESYDNFGQFKSKIHIKTLPKGYVFHTKNNHTWFYSISGNAEHVPKLLASLLVTEDLEMKAYVRSAVLPFSAFEHLISSQQLKSTIQFAYILSLWKSFSDETYRSTGNFYLLKLAITVFEQAIAEKIAKNHFDNFLVASLKFVVEQLNLIQVSKHGRRYSLSLITTSLLRQMASTSLYKKLRYVLILPSLSLLLKFFCRMTVQS